MEVTWKKNHIPSVFVGKNMSFLILKQIVMLGLNGKSVTEIDPLYAPSYKLWKTLMLRQGHTEKIKNISFVFIVLCMIAFSNPLTIYSNVVSLIIFYLLRHTPFVYEL